MNARQRATGVRCWPVCEWPEADRRAWLDAQKPCDPFQPGGAAAAWSAQTIKMAANGYGRWLAYLDTSGQFEPDEAPAVRVTMDRVAAYVDTLALVNAPFSVQTRVRQLGYAMRAMAPDQDWGWILRGADRLRAVATPARDKRRRLVAPSELIKLGLAIIDAAEKAEHLTAIRRAVEYRNGLLIAFLAYRPLRKGDLAKLSVGTHLQRQAIGWYVDIVTSKTKTHVEMLFPPQLQAQLDRYLAIHRPVLLDVGLRHGRAPTDAVWVTAIGTRATTAIIALQISRRTRLAFGEPVNPHLFRDCAATWIADIAPEQAGIIRQILGHTTMATSERHYNHAASLHAVDRYQETIAELRRPAKRSARVSVEADEPDTDDVLLQEA